MADLLPGHAIQVGRFFQRAINQNGNQFRRHLSTYVDHQKDQLNTIYALLNVLSRGEGISMCEIRERFLEVLQGNPLLESWFLQLFPKTEEEEDQRGHRINNLDNSIRAENTILMPAHLTQLLWMTERDEEEQEQQQPETVVDEPETFYSIEFVSPDKKQQEKNRDTPRRKKRGRTITSYFHVVDHSPPKNAKCPEPTGWTREEDHTLFSTINGLNDCPEDKVLKVLYDTFPEKDENDIVTRFHVMVNLIQSLVK